MYTIRCDAENFKLRRSHKRVIKNFNNFIKYGTKLTRAAKTKDDSQTVDMDDCKEQRAKAQQSASNFDENAKFKHFQEGTSSNEALSTSSVLKTKSDQLKSTITVNETDACTSPKKTKANNPSKKKYMRRQKLIAKIVKRQSCSEEEAKQILFERSEQKRKTKTLEEFLSESSNCPEVKHVFKVLITKHQLLKLFILITFRFAEKVHSA